VNLFCNNSSLKPLSLTDFWSGFCAWSVDFLGGLKENVMPAEVSDDTLAEQMQQGDDGAFAKLYERYFQKIYSFTIRRVSNQHIAEDLVSEIFTKCFAKRATFTLRPSFAAWLYRVATNTITDYYRTSKTAFSIDDAETTFEPVEPRENMITKTDQILLGEVLEQVLEKLTQRERIAVTMKYYAEATHEEIAKVLKCTPNNAGVIVHRSLKKCAHLAGHKLKSLL